MGMEVFEEFRPITPLRTLTTTVLQVQVAAGKQPKERRSDFEVGDGDGDEECQTPTAAGSRLKPTMVCPPAPKKPRPPRRKLNFPPPPFFEAPQDLNSVFFQLQTPSKKIRAAIST